MGDYAFISYSHQEDGGYVGALADYLGKDGVSAWFDREIVFGDRWARQIREKIDNCGAFIIVMTQPPRTRPGSPARYFGPKT